MAIAANILATSTIRLRPIRRTVIVNGMPLNQFALFFRQDFDGGYRYLDRCGEFLVRSQERFGLLPSGDPSPQSGALESPDLGIKVEANTTMLRVTQELPAADSGVFREVSEGISALYSELFTPLSVEKNGVAIHSFVPFANPAQAESLTLKWASAFGDNSAQALSRTLGMPASGKVAEQTLRSGSRELHVKYRAVTFEKVSLNRRNAAISASKRTVERIGRQNKATDKLLGLDLSHAAFLELDLIEYMPPPNSFAALLAELLEKHAVMAKQLPTA